MIVCPVGAGPAAAAAQLHIAAVLYNLRAFVACLPPDPACYNERILK